MREDMKEVIITPGRHKRKYGKEAKHHYQRTNKHDEDSPSMGKMRKERDTESKDHLAPLVRYLRSNCGRPYDKVFSDICKNNKLNSTIGRHLRQHVDSLVIKEQHVVELFRRTVNGNNSYFFFVDNHGILRPVQE